jgi:hypothetical protein
MADVMVGYPGASPKEVESRVVKPLEKIISNIKGVEHVHSMAMNGQAMIIVQFYVGEDTERSYCETGAVRLFLDGTAALGFVKVKDGDTTKAGQVGLRPGIAVKLNDHFSFIAKYGFLGYRRNINTLGDSFGLELTSEDLSIGFHYAF